jgi:cysteine-rich repeat protein
MAPLHLPRLSSRSTLLGLTALLGACSVFDATLYRQRQQQDMTPLDSGTVTRALADNCQSSVPVVLGSDQAFSTDTTALTNSFTALADCTGHTEIGNDGFFAVDMDVGERWHFHLHPTTPGIDPAVYVLSTCDDRTCTTGDGEDECGPDRDEHMSFVAPSKGRFLIGISSRMSGGGHFDMLAIHPICGNGIKEHSEACDDHNTISGDGCDDHCRAELYPPRAAEVEPNDDALGANDVMITPSSSMIVTGRLGGRCDYDTYALQVPAGASIRATMLDLNGMPCQGAAPPLLMMLVRSDGHTVGGQAVTHDGTCPSIVDQTFAKSITPGGTYYIRVTTVNDEVNVFDYSLQIELH